MTPGVQREREYKLTSDRAIALEAVRELAAARGLALRVVRSIRQTDTYFDTPQFDLARTGRGLRLRESPRSRTLGLKTEVGKKNGLHEREEVEAPFSGSVPARSDRLPDALRERVRSIAGSAALSPVAILRTTRRRLVTGDGAERIEIAIDAVDVLDADGRVAGSFHECEIELGERVEPAPWSRLADALKGELGLSASRGNKLRRALELLEIGIESDRPAILRGDTPANEAARTALTALLRQMQAEEARVRERTSIKGVHKLRVACRRGRAAVRTFASVLPDDAARSLARLFQRTAKAFAVVRDLDVLLDDLRRDAEALPPALAKQCRKIRRQLAAARSELFAAGRGDLDRKRRRKDLDRVERFLTATDAEPSAPLSDFAPEHIRAAADAVLAFAPQDSQRLSDDDVHGLRLALKQLRYCAELFLDVYGDSLARFADRMAHLQELSGRQHDAVVAGARFADLADRRGGLKRRAVLTLGALLLINARRAESAREALDAARADLAPNDLRVLLDAILRRPARN